MSERFIKFIPSEEAMYLLKKKGHAFRLLTIIAEAARRYENGTHGLRTGEAFIGGFEDYDMTEQNYRTAKKILEKRGHIEIVETCRTRKGLTEVQRNSNTKITTEVTTVGTKVKLLSSSVYDINIDAPNDRSNERLTTDQRPTNDKQRNKEVKNTKKQQPQTPLNESNITDTIGPNVAADVVVVFSCLEKLPDSKVSRKRKIEITKKYQKENNEQAVINAVAVVTAEGFEPNETFEKSLNAALKGKWKPSLPTANDVDKNKNLAINLENIKHGYKFVASPKGLEIIRGANGIPGFVPYQMSEDKFIQDVEKQGRIDLVNVFKIKKVV